MSKSVKLAVAAVVVILGLASMGMVSLNDGIKRPGYCATCHEEPHFRSWEHSDYLAQRHADAAIRCQTCHPQTVSKGVHNIFVRVRGNYRLRRLRVPKRMCLQCHAHDSYAALVERTGGRKKNPHQSHYGEIDCRICHKMHQPSVDYCSACHDPTTRAPGWVQLPKLNIQRGKPPTVMPSELPH